MRRFFLISSFLALFAIGSSAQWKPAGDKIKTDWASQINPANVLPEYPRPIMERSDWKNLNGLWNYAVINKGEHLPAEFEGQILVPFAIESSLSGVGKESMKTRNWSTSAVLKFLLPGRENKCCCILVLSTGKRMYG